MQPKPDPRWQNIIGGTSPSGWPEPMTQERLQKLAEDWAEVVAETASFGGSELLERARSHFVQSWWDYELMVTACLVGLQAVEATFRLVLYPDISESLPFGQLVTRAQDEDWFSEEKADTIRAGVELRNHLSHPKGRTAFTLGITASILHVCHLVVRDICFMKGLRVPRQA